VDDFKWKARHAAPIFHWLPFHRIRAAPDPPTFSGGHVAGRGNHNAVRAQPMVEAVAQSGLVEFAHGSGVPKIGRRANVQGQKPAKNFVQQRLRVSRFHMISSKDHLAFFFLHLRNRTSLGAKTRSAMMPRRKSGDDRRALLLETNLFFGGERRPAHSADGIHLSRNGFAEERA